jgi:pentose-5-phosphate-3-epimerase
VTTNAVKLAPSILTADFARLGDQVAAADAITAPLAVAAGADVLVAGSTIFNDSEGVTAAMRQSAVQLQLGRKSCSLR